MPVPCPSRLPKRERGEPQVLGRTRTLDSHASRVRRKLAAVTDAPYVLNEWGVGYRLMPPA